MTANDECNYSVTNNVRRPNYKIETYTVILYGTIKLHDKNL